MFFHNSIVSPNAGGEAKGDRIYTKMRASGVRWRHNPCSGMFPDAAASATGRNKMRRNTT
jgi:hypothetical protein